MESPLTEQEVIRRVSARFTQLGAGVVQGIGDDAAVLDLAGQASSPVNPTAGESPAPPRYLFTTDTLVEGVHFDLSYMSLADVGYKALAVNLSDINAMGGRSATALGTLGVPRGATAAGIDLLLDGIAAALQLCTDAGQHCSLIGGDTVAAPQWLTGFTVVGEVPGAPLLRSGAKPGDELWHSGTLGLSGVGLSVLQNAVRAELVSGLKDAGIEGAAGNLPGGDKLHPYEAAVHAHLRPLPPLALGPWLQGNGIASAAQDLSDSLSQVMLQLAGASSVGVELDFREYPFAAEVLAAKPGGERAAAFLLRQAEDYQLLFTVPAQHSAMLAQSPVPLRRASDASWNQARETLTAMSRARDIRL